MRFSNIIFDLDGTLTNPSEGILNSLRHSLKQLLHNEIPETIPEGFIGPPLQQGFKTIYGLNDKQTENAVKYFRDYYGKYGKYENVPYDGIIELLAELSINGKKLFVATSKYEKFSWEIIKHFEMDRYITDLQGAGYSGNHDKSTLIDILIEKYQLVKEDTAMVGDTSYDIEGARASLITSVAVGYGFHSMEDLAKLSPDFLVEDVDELFECLMA
ncbi:MAG: HAD hydrolase-like protein [Bacteroidales bacterium]|nr:HAD hydrolase-like protein [Bacteroidales bacterium]MBN2819738.1 HAD hydrolase-like protein [Bacteroidales bacterium]